MIWGFFPCDCCHTLFNDLNELTKYTKQDTSTAGLTGFHPFLRENTHTIAHTRYHGYQMIYINIYMAYTDKQVSRSADGFIRSLAFNIMLKLHVFHHKILWLAHLLSHHNWTALSACGLSPTFSKQSPFVWSAPPINCTNQANRPEFLLTEPNRLRVNTL